MRLLPREDHYRNLGHNTKALLAASLSNSAWKKYNSAKNCYLRFAASTNSGGSWPISKSSLREFCVWALSVGNLSPSTTQEYLGGLRTLHTVSLLDSSAFDEPVLKYLTRGARNLGINRPRENKRRAVTLPLLKRIIYKIRSSTLPQWTKSSLLCLCLLAFFGAMRLGELVSNQRGSFDPSSTLLIGDVAFGSDSISLLIRSPKVYSDRGDIVDLFQYPSLELCPVHHMRLHRDMLQRGAMWSSNMPVFRSSDGAFFTTKFFNSLLKESIGDDIDWERHSISAHSFRAGLPSQFQRVEGSPDLSSWGRWRSSAANLYRRQGFEENRAKFKKISSTLTSANRRSLTLSK